VLGSWIALEEFIPNPLREAKASLFQTAECGTEINQPALSSRFQNGNCSSYAQRAAQRFAPSLGFVHEQEIDSGV